MKTLHETLRKPIVSKEDAEAFMTQLVADELDWHFDDCAIDCLHKTNLHVSLADAVLLNDQRDCLYDFEYEEECPIGFILKLREM